MGIYAILGNFGRFGGILTQFQRYFDNAFSARRKCIRKGGKMAACGDRGKAAEQMKIDKVSMGIYGILGNSRRFWGVLPQFRRYFNNAFFTLRKCIRKEGQNGHCGT
jgi:hypothetical protein